VYISLEKHSEKCAVEGNKKITFSKSKYFQFRKEQNRISIAYRIFFKIATYFKKDNGQFDTTKQLKYTRVEGNFTAASFCIIVLNPKDELEENIYYDGVHVMENFFDVLFSLSTKYQHKVSHEKQPLVITEAMRQEHELATNCPHCKLTFDKKGRRKTFHHSHVVATENVSELNCYLGNRVVCGTCNLKFTQKSSVVIGHNISKLECHLILQSLNTNYSKTARIICKNSEKIVAMTINKRRFVDFQNFMDSPIFDLVERLRKLSFNTGDAEHFHRFNETFSGTRNKYLLQWEFAFPHLWLESEKNLDFSSLPEKEYFF
jgi:hypothetical protein